MRLLADENFPKTIVAALRTRGLDVLWARTDCQGWSDTELLTRAEDEGRILLTLDRDFYQIALQRRVPLIASGVVLFRVHPATCTNLQPLVVRWLEVGTEWTGRVSVVSPDRIQVLSTQSRR